MKSNMTFLKEVKKYIEKSEQAFEDEFGSARNISEMIDKKAMPKLYWEVLQRITLEKAFSG